MRGRVVGLSGPLALVLLLPMEAGVPIPLPADLVMFTVGERVAAGRFSLWLAVAGFEVVAILGTTVLFLACRGPAQRIIARFGPRLGLTEARLRRASDFAATRGRPGLVRGGGGRAGGGGAAGGGPRPGGRAPAADRAAPRRAGGPRGPGGARGSGGDRRSGRDRRRGQLGPRRRAGGPGALAGLTNLTI